MAFAKGISFFYPMVFAFILLIFSSVPLYIAGTPSFFPAIDIMIVFYWSSQRPGALPNWFIFLLGVFRDVVEGLTLGVGSFVYLITKFMVVASRRIYRRANFLVIWQGFAIVALLAITLKWLLVSFIMGFTLSPDNAIMQFMLSVAIYPAMHWLFNLVASTMPEKFHDE